jgi:hypothetical protein
MMSKLIKIENFARKLKNLGLSLSGLIGEGRGCTGGGCLILFIELL